MLDAAVVVVAPPGDAHTDAVQDALGSASVPTIRLSATTVTSSRLTWSPGAPLVVDYLGERWCVSERSTVWWRRVGRAGAAIPTPMESALVADEVHTLLPGVLEAVGVRWVDAPWSQFQARLKAHQLSVAHALAISIPRTLVTGAEDDAALFSPAKPVVAKAASTGTGIAPFVDVVTADELRLVSACPTILQERVDGYADARVVTVGEHQLVWVRPRFGDAPPDWRAVDPDGRGFVYTSEPHAIAAVQIAHALGLTFSVQDWLLTSNGPVFLEVNAQGQWLFLDGATEQVVPALVRHLSLSSGPSDQAASDAWP